MKTVFLGRGIALLLLWAVLGGMSLEIKPAAAQGGAGRRVALVVGVGNYDYMGRLTNPSNDARLLAQTLQRLGFSLVGNGPLLHPNRATFEGAIQAFGREARGADVALFFFAGHGLQVDGVNWLVPASANPTSRQDLPFQMVSADLVLSQLETSGARLKILILDACRNNPMPRGLRSGGDGLAQMRAPMGTIISYATQPGNVAADGAGGNSPFTAALAAAMVIPGLDVLRMFNRVGVQVSQTTRGNQQPWTAASPIEGDFYFAGLGSQAVPNPRPPVEAEQDETKLARGSTPSFYSCSAHSQCQPGNVCVDNGGDGRFYCKPLCDDDAQCRRWPFPQLRCYPHRRQNQSMFTRRICNDQPSFLHP